MKLHYLLAGVFYLLLFPSQAQNNLLPDDEPLAKASDTIGLESSEDPEMMHALFSKAAATSTNRKGCSLIQNKWRDRKVYNLKNGYKIVTADEEEVIVVKQTSKGQRLKYYNEYETLTYHMKENGKVHYHYDYINECKKVKLERRKNGITSIKNRSDMDMVSIRSNVRNAITTAIQSCGMIK